MVVVVATDKSSRSREWGEQQSENKTQGEKQSWCVCFSASTIYLSCLSNFFSACRLPTVCQLTIIGFFIFCTTLPLFFLFCPEARFLLGTALPISFVLMDKNSSSVIDAKNLKPSVKLVVDCDCCYFVFYLIVMFRIQNTAVREVNVRVNLALFLCQKEN